MDFLGSELTLAMRCELRGDSWVLCPLCSRLGAPGVPQRLGSGSASPLSWLKVVTNRLVMDLSSLLAREMRWMPSVTLLTAL